MNFSRKDKIALPVACLTGFGFGYLAVEAGFGGVVVGGFYSLIVIPLIVRFVAEQRKLVVWQVCALSFFAYIMVENASLGGFGIGEVLIEFHAIWGAEVVLSFPVPAYYYFQRAKKRRSYRLELFLAGLLFFGLLSSLWRDPFLIFGAEAAWVIGWLVKIAWDWFFARNRVNNKILLLSAGIAFAVLCAYAVAAVARSQFKQSALFAAVGQKDSGVVEWLLKTGADPNAYDTHGNTPLALAAWNGDTRTVKILLARGADPNEQQRGFFQGLMPSGTALAVAASAGRTEICEALLDAGADVNAKNAYGQTPLVAGLALGDLSCALMLMGHGANVNSRTSSGETPLLLLMPFDTDNDPAAHQVLEALLSRGADVSAKDDKGRTVEDLAIQYHRAKTEQQLQQIRELPK